MTEQTQDIAQFVWRRAKGTRALLFVAFLFHGVVTLVPAVGIGMGLAIAVGVALGVVAWLHTWMVDIAEARRMEAVPFEPPRQAAAERERVNPAANAALRYVLSLYRNGEPDKEKLHPNGQPIGSVPWSKNGKWGEPLTPEEQKQAAGYLLDEPPAGGPSLFSRYGNNYTLNCSDYPTEAAVLAAFAPD